MAGAFPARDGTESLAANVAGFRFAFLEEIPVSLFRFAVLFLLLFLLLVPAFADSYVTHERTVTKLAEGVYEIRHPDAPDGFPQGNTTVIIGGRGVLVVDSCFFPASAREDIAQIR